MTANMVAVAMATVIAADDNEDGSGEAVVMAGNGGSGGDMHCAKCKGRGLEVIGVDGNDEDCGKDAGGGKGILGYVGLRAMTTAAERTRMRRRKMVRPMIEQRAWVLVEMRRRLTSLRRRRRMSPL